MHLDQRRLARQSARDEYHPPVRQMADGLAAEGRVGQLNFDFNRLVRRYERKLVTLLDQPPADLAIDDGERM